MPSSLRPGEAALCRECRYKNGLLLGVRELCIEKGTTNRLPIDYIISIPCPLSTLWNPGLRVVAGVEQCDWFTKREESKQDG